MIIGVDVDLTLVQSDLGWFDWLNSISDHYHSYESVVGQGKLVPYNLNDLYPDVPHAECVHFWRRKCLYDDMTPIANAVSALEQLSKDHDIVFVSALKGDHHKSKFNFLKTHFPFMKGFIGTKEKQFARVDLLIDDRHKNLNAVEKVGIIPMKYHTPYEQEEDFQGLTIFDWSENSINQINQL